VPEQPIETLPGTPPIMPPGPPDSEPPLHELDAQEREHLAKLPTATRLAWEAFRRDLPQLLRHSPRMCVAYTPNGRIGEPNRSDMELYRFCLDQGLKPEEFLVLPIEPRAAHLLHETEV
jgi:hypothetical protein